MRPSTHTTYVQGKLSLFGPCPSHWHGYQLFDPMQDIPVLSRPLNDIARALPDGLHRCGYIADGRERQNPARRTGGGEQGGLIRFDQGTLGHIQHQTMLRRVFRGCQPCRQ